MTGGEERREMEQLLDLAYSRRPTGISFGLIFIYNFLLETIVVISTVT